MTLTQINSTDWLLKEGSWEFILSTATQYHPNSQGALTAEPDVLRQAREAMIADFINFPPRQDEYYALNQVNAATALVQYCSIYHPTLDVSAAITQCETVANNLPPMPSMGAVAAHLMSPHPTQGDITAAQDAAESYADGLFETIMGTPVPAVAYDTLQEIAAYIASDTTNYSSLLTALGNRIRFDIANQGLSAQERTNAKTNLGVENIDNTSDANKPVSSAVTSALSGKANTAHSHSTSDVTGLDTALAGKQATLVSGVNIKTVGGVSLLGTGDVPVGGGGATRITLASDFPSTSVTRVAVTLWTFPVTAGQVYEILINAAFQTAATTTGGSMGFVLTSGTGTIIGKMEVDVAQTAVATGLKQTIRAINATNTTAGSFMTSSGVGAINSPHNWQSKVHFACTTTGVFVVQWATEVAASEARLLAGSHLFWKAV